MVIENLTCAQRAAVRFVPRAGDGEDRCSRRAGELDCGGADAGGAAPDYYGAVQRGGVKGGVGEGEVVALVEACGCGGDGEGEDDGALERDGAWDGGDGDCGCEDVLLEGAVGGVVG